MAHELTLRADGKAEMAFVGETPWHGLGQNVTKGASIGVWAKEAGMDWEARTAAPIFTPVLGVKNKASAPRVVEDSKIIYRSDTGAPLSIVSKDYRIVQPRDVLEFFRREVEKGGWHIHTAGTMRGGRKFWAMATCEDSTRFIVKKGKKDRMVRNLLCASSLDGSMRTVAKLTDVRVVCANTLAQALGALSNGDRVEISHRSLFDPRAIKKALGIAMDTYDDFIEQCRELAETPINVEEATAVLEQIFVPTPKKEIDTSWIGGNLADIGKAPDEPEMHTPRSLARILALFQGEGMGADMSTAKGTKWGLLNAVTQHVDHDMGRTPDTRLDSAWFGRGSGMKAQAFELLDRRGGLTWRPLARGAGSPLLSTTPSRA
jgi:phage/plasmid-like protein (TIGR03299 family)